MVISRQNKLRIDLAAVRDFADRLGREMRLGRRHFNVCLVDDEAIRELNGAFRNKPYATDVLSFAWMETAPGRARDRQARLFSAPARDREFDAFLGDVVISVETAQRNACAEGHSTAAEIRWLILHGLLHLLGMDHETDRGEMESLELNLRARLRLNGSNGTRGLAGTKRKSAGNRTQSGARRRPRASNNGLRNSDQI